MKSVNFKEPQIALVVATVLLVIVILFYCIASMVTSIGYQTYLEAENYAKQVDAAAKMPFLTVILDAGHGGEDPGTIANGVTEKDLNLAVTQKVADFLSLSGCRVILTRTTDRMLYNSGEEDKKKAFDLYNRVKIAKQYENQNENVLFVSIHMNSYPSEICHGLQTFYKAGREDERQLAGLLQETAKMLLPGNTRVEKADDRDLYILQNSPVTTVLVECGFLTNREEAEHLSDENYQKKLAFCLCQGIIKCTEDLQHEDELHLQSMR